MPKFNINIFETTKYAIDNMIDFMDIIDCVMDMMI